MQFNRLTSIYTYEGQFLLYFLSLHLLEICMNLKILLYFFITLKIMNILNFDIYKMKRVED